MQEWFSFQRGENRTYVLASDVVFMKALRNTFLFVLVVAPLQGGLALLLALMVNQKLRGINFFRAVYFMPVVVSIVVVSLLWRFIYAGDNGLLNNVLSWVTLRRRSSRSTGSATPRRRCRRSSPCRSGRRWAFTW